MIDHDCTYEDCQRPATEDSQLCRVHQLRTQARTGTAGTDATVSILDETNPPKKAPAKRTRKAPAKKTTAKKAAD